MTPQLIYNEADDYYEVATDSYNRRYADWRMAVMDVAHFQNGVELVGVLPEVEPALRDNLLALYVQVAEQRATPRYRPGPRTVARRERKYMAEER